MLQGDETPPVEALQEVCGITDTTMVDAQVVEDTQVLTERPGDVTPGADEQLPQLIDN